MVIYKYGIGLHVCLYAMYHMTATFRELEWATENPTADLIDCALDGNLDLPDGLSKSEKRKI